VDRGHGSDGVYGWIYDHLKPHAAALKVAHPLMLRAIAAAKKKNDPVDVNKICNCLRCDFLPECYMASTAIRERRRTLSYRNLLPDDIDSDTTGFPVCSKLNTTAIVGRTCPTAY
jgi:hypothetical protein